MQPFVEEYEAEGFTIYVISRGDGVELDYLDRLGYKVLIGSDIWSTYGVSSIPIAFFIDYEGTLVDSSLGWGGTDPISRFRQKVNAVLARGGPAFLGASSWAIAELNEAAAYGFITDRIKNDMDAPVTREEFCEVVMRLYGKTGEDVPVGTSPFTDTNNPEILKAARLGIVLGVGGGRFAPRDLIKRQEIAVMVVRAVAACQPDLDLTPEDVGRFRDETKIAPWAFDAIRWLYGKDIFKGLPDGRIDPLGTTTREQAVILVLRTYEYLKG